MSEVQAPSADTNGTTQPAAAAPAVSSSSSGNDALVCQWQNCGERLPSAEELYDHVCERHVGRKSTNNLNLTCQWGNCRTTTVKRDHITSHIRVHVPLKPHKCDFCGKAFKRPQDLKKHVKTHADDSVLLRSPEPNRAGHGGATYHTQAGKLVADLQSLAATASGYYPDHHSIGGQPVYYSSATATPATYHGGSAPQQGSAYGPVYYAVSQPTNANAEYELRKRAAFDALNEFFGDAKRRMIDPTTYYDVGQRLASLNSVQLPMLNGYSSGGVSDYPSAGSTVATAPQPLLQQQYSLPLPNLRTKTDLLNIDQFLDQLQTTVYENSNQAAAAGVAQAGSHYVPAHMEYKSHSPPALHAGSHSSAHASSVTPGSTGPETPALTPASSVLSYPSAHSPSSVHSAQTISPISRSSISSMYPTLPGVSSMDIANFAQTSGPPAAGLASIDADGRRRWSGGQLQKARAPSSGATTPTALTPRQNSSDQLPKVDKLGLNSPVMKTASLDPALRSPRASTETSEEHDRSNEAWVENIRIIEALRSFIKEKLEKGDFEDEKAASPSASAAAAPAAADADAMDTSEDAKNLYPILREVQGETA